MTSISEYQKCGLTEHEMRCIGLGLPINERLTYAITYKNERVIGTMTAFYGAKSRQDAINLFDFDRPGNFIVAVELL